MNRGLRRTCPACSARFYDLNRPTPACPRCGALFDAAVITVQMPAVEPGSAYGPAAPPTKRKRQADGEVVLAAIPVGPGQFRSPIDHDDQTDAHPGTLETRRKLKGSVIERLVRQRRLDDDHLTAARMLGAIWTEIEMGSGSPDSITRLALAGCSGSLTSKELVRHIFWTPLYSLVFRPWLADMDASDPSDVQILKVVICNNVGPRQVDKYCGYRNGTAFTKIKRALTAFHDLYARNFKSLKIGG